MIKKIKRLLGIKEEEVIIADPPGRTFKRIHTGDYFSSEKADADPEMIARSKQNKIDQIKTWELKPKYIRFKYKQNISEDAEKDELLFAHVVFQKEVFAKKWNMLHVTEISFNVKGEDIEEFESMAEVKVNEDFIDLTEIHYGGVERRQKERTTS